MKELRGWKMFLVIAIMVATGWQSRAASERPNIVFILSDDMGFSDVSCFGGKLLPTPNIDQLAREGTKFMQFYSPAPVCSPSRTGFTTGMFPGRWKITNFLQTKKGNRDSEQVDFLDPKAPTIARTLKAAGYATGHFGKWHMGGGRDVRNAPPFSAYGFDEHSSTYESPEPDPMITATNWIFSPFDTVKRWDRTAYFVDKALDFLKRHKGEPCYVNLWPDDVHTPWVPKGNSLSQRDPAVDESQKSFIAVMAEYDKQIGRFEAGLKALGLESNTIVIFTSDNGPLPTLRGERSGGMRGSKDSLYEGGTRMPFIVRWPGHIPAGRVDAATVMDGVDFFPTFCTFAGTTLPEGKFDGEDMSRAFLGDSIERKKSIFWEYGRTATFGHPRGRNRSPNVAVREGKWKLLVNADGSDVQLYDELADRNETENLATQDPEIAQQLKEEVLQWRKSLP